ncbi:MAG: pyridoxal phosphate-dependent aminotransferase [Chloroflexota bacterium]
MKGLARDALNLPASGIREIVNLAIDRPDVIRLEVGEPDFPTPPHIIEAAHQAARDGFTRYTQSSGMTSLRELLADKVRRVNGQRDVTPERITIGVGGVEVILATLSALLDPGDEILVPDPGWPNTEMIAISRGAIPVRYPLQMAAKFVPRIEDLEARVSPRTKVLAINSPSNPTGAVFSRGSMLELVQFAQRHDLYVLADEVYDQLVFEGEHVSPRVFDPERVISIFSCSKTYAMTGWRVGYAASNPDIAALLMKLQEPLISCVSGVCQKAAEAALLGPQDCVETMRLAYRQRRDRAFELLGHTPLVRYQPHGAFYLMVDVSASGLDSRSFALQLLNQKGVAVAPGTAFGEASRECVRVSLASSLEQLTEGLLRIHDFVEQLAERPAGITSQASAL